MVCGVSQPILLSLILEWKLSWAVTILFQAIDVWNNICVSFVFLALLEYALVNYAARADVRWALLTGS